MKNFFSKIKERFSKSEQVEVVPSLVNRAIRIGIKPRHKVKFLLGADEIEIFNISSTGLALVTSSFQVTPATKSKISGLLIVEEESFPLVLEIVHVAKSTGCRILKMDHGLRNKILKYFAHEIVAGNLYPLRSDILKPDADGVAHGFVGDDRCELFYVVRDGIIIKFNMIVFGYYVEMDKSGAVKIGQIKNAESLNPGEYKKSDMLITNIVSPDRALLDSLERFLECVEKLPENFRKQIIEKIQSLV
jgi:hypothetical protein